MITIAIDAMGGDIGPSVTVPAALRILSAYPKIIIILVGGDQRIKQYLPKTYDQQRLIIQHASEQVEMDESPVHALRNKKDSSMRVAMNLVKEGRANACVSAGNTGALVATGHFVLKTFQGIDRPAILSMFPTRIPEKKMRLLDSGANVDCKAENLLQFAVMASVMASAVDNVEKPSVYLLNIGEEDIKGNEQVKKSSELLSGLKSINYQGYIEGNKIFDGKADIVVVDGFVGNVALKACEGTAFYIIKTIQEAFNRNILTKLIGLFAKPILRLAFKNFDPKLYNGATILGLQGTVVKSHGSATTKAFARAIEEAIFGVEKNVPELIRHEVSELLKSLKSE